jgi:hypothetical protein
MIFLAETQRKQKQMTTTARHFASYEYAEIEKDTWADEWAAQMPAVFKELWSSVQHWPAFPLEAGPGNFVPYFDHVHEAKIVTECPDASHLTKLSLKECHALVSQWLYDDIETPVHRERIMGMLRTKRDISLTHDLNDARVVHDMLILPAFASAAGRELIVDMANNQFARCRLQREEGSLWFEGKAEDPSVWALIRADLDAMADLALHSFAYDGGRMTVHAKDVIEKLPVLMAGVKEPLWHTGRP